MLGKSHFFFGELPKHELSPQEEVMIEEFSAYMQLRSQFRHDPEKLAAVEKRMQDNFGAQSWVSFSERLRAQEFVPQPAAPFAEEPMARPAPGTRSLRLEWNKDALTLFPQESEPIIVQAQEKQDFAKLHTEDILRLAVKQVQSLDKEAFDLQVLGKLRQAQQDRPIEILSNDQGLPVCVCFSEEVQKAFTAKELHRAEELIMRDYREKANLPVQEIRQETVQQNAVLQL